MLLLGRRLAPRALQADRLEDSLQSRGTHGCTATGLPKAPLLRPTCAALHMQLRARESPLDARRPGCSCQPRSPPRPSYTIERISGQDKSATIPSPLNAHLRSRNWRGESPLRTARRPDSITSFSVKSWAAAYRFTSRNNESGISTVVFISPTLPYLRVVRYGSMGNENSYGLHALIH